MVRDNKTAIGAKGEIPVGLTPFAWFVIFVGLAALAGLVTVVWYALGDWNERR